VACREADERRPCYVYDIRYMYRYKDALCQFWRQKLKQSEEPLLRITQCARIVRSLVTTWTTLAPVFHLVGLFSAFPLTA
jgi:hypothetical protein